MAQPENSRPPLFATIGCGQSVHHSMMVADFLDPLFGELEHLRTESPDHSPITSECAVKEWLRHPAPVVAHERAEVTPTIRGQ